MDIEISKLTTKYQATIPKAVRNLLHLSSGDALRFVMDDDVVRIEKARPLDIDIYKLSEHALEEWNSKEDDEAFKNL